MEEHGWLHTINYGEIQNMMEDDLEQNHEDAEPKPCSWCGRPMIKFSPEQKRYQMEHELEDYDEYCEVCDY